MASQRLGGAVSAPGLSSLCCGCSCVCCGVTVLVVVACVCTNIFRKTGSTGVSRLGGNPENKPPLSLHCGTMALFSITWVQLVFPGLFWPSWGRTTLTDKSSSPEAVLFGAEWQVCSPSLQPGPGNRSQFKIWRVTSEHSVMLTWQIPKLLGSSDWQKQLAQENSYPSKTPI